MDCHLSVLKTLFCSFRVVGLERIKYIAILIDNFTLMNTIKNIYIFKYISKLFANIVIISAGTKHSFIIDFS